MKFEVPHVLSPAFHRKNKVHMKSLEEEINRSLFLDDWVDTLNPILCQTQNALIAIVQMTSLRTAKLLRI